MVSALQRTDCLKAHLFECKHDARRTTHDRRLVRAILVAAKVVRG
jgi:hypothetical protein